MSLCLLLGTALAAAPTSLQVADTAAPAFSVYGTRDGLSDEIWSTVGFDGAGFAWAGSASALARFDGYRWTTAALPQARSLVRDMAASDDGTLWAIFEREGLARYDGRAWSLVGTSSYFARFAQLGDGAQRTLWATHATGVSQLRDGVWHEDPGNAVSGFGRAVGLAQTRLLAGSPRQWLGSASEGLWYRELLPVPGPWQRCSDPQLQDLQITDLHASQVGGVEELWVLTYGNGLLRLRNDGVRTWREERGELPSEALYSMAETHTSAGERLLWVASRAGLLRVRGEQVDVFDRRHGLPSDAVRGVKVQRDADGSEVLWLATEGGIVRAALADSPWQTVSLIGARENGVFGLLLEPDDTGGERLWVGSARDGLRLLQHGQWRAFTQATGELPQRGVRGLWRLPGADGRAHRLLGVIGAPLLEIDDALRIVPRATPWPVHPEESAAYAMAREYEGALEWWVGTLRSGVYRWRDGTWTAYTLPGNATPWTVLRLAEQIDATGRSWLWAAGPLGLARFDGTGWQAVTAPADAWSGGARSVTVIPEQGAQVLWVSTNRHGIVRLGIDDPLQPTVLDSRRIPPPPDPTVYSVLRDSVGRIYSCTNNGVQQLTPQAGGGYSERVFLRRDGLVHDECNTNSQLIDGADRYWVGTLGGLSVYDPDVQPADTAAQVNPLHVTAVRIDGAERMLPDDAPLHLAAGARELRIEYALLTGLRENESRYRTQLLGDDPVPSEWTPDHSRSFANLAPGRHTLLIEARNFAGIAAQPRMLEFTVAPRWWQRPSLQALLVALTVLGGIAIVLAYNRGLRLRQRQLMGQVAARTAELRSANERLTELSYLDPLTGLANRRRLMEALGAAIARAREQSLPMGLIVIDVDHFKHYNDCHGHLAGDIALRAVATALTSATREQDLVARFGGEEFACLVLDVDLPAVARIAERMRALVEALPPRSLGNDEHTVTISAGVVHRVPGADTRAEDLLSTADVALYDAKKAGRNCVVTAAA